MQLYSYYNIKFFLISFEMLDLFISFFQTCNFPNQHSHEWINNLYFLCLRWRWNALDTKWIYPYFGYSYSNLVQRATLSVKFLIRLAIQMLTNFTMLLGTPFTREGGPGRLLIIWITMQRSAMNGTENNRMIITWMQSNVTVPVIVLVSTGKSSLIAVSDSPQSTPTWSVTIKGPRGFLLAHQCHIIQAVVTVRQDWFLINDINPDDWFSNTKTFIIVIFMVLQIRFFGPFIDACQEAQL